MLKALYYERKFKKNPSKQLIDPYTKEDSQILSQKINKVLRNNNVSDDDKEILLNAENGVAGVRFMLDNPKFQSQYPTASFMYRRAIFGDGSKFTFEKGTPEHEAFKNLKGVKLLKEKCNQSFKEIAETKEFGTREEYNIDNTFINDRLKKLKNDTITILSTEPIKIIQNITSEETFYGEHLEKAISSVNKSIAPHFFNKYGNSDWPTSVVLSSEYADTLLTMGSGKAFCEFSGEITKDGFTGQTKLKINDYYDFNIDEDNSIRNLSNLYKTSSVLEKYGILKPYNYTFEDNYSNEFKINFKKNK